LSKMGCSGSKATEAEKGTPPAAELAKSGTVVMSEQVAKDAIDTALVTLTPSGSTQSAFVFAKPHANKPAVLELILKKFAEVGIEVVSEGEIDGPTIDTKQYIDQHYYAIASKATLMAPADLPVPVEKFKEKFGEEWQTVLAEGRAFNAIEACKQLDVDANALKEIWEGSKEKDKLIKLGGGFYCALLEVEGKPPIYTFNAFFMSMRTKFTAADAVIHYYVVKFDPAKLSWADFRGKVLGPTDPAKAPSTALRGMLMEQWESLGLAAPPNTSDNGVHASASPFEGLAEKMNWLQTPLESDEFGKALLAAGISEAMIKAWAVDPQVNLPGGGKGSLFDSLEDLDIDSCTAKAVAIAGVN